jgi:hypothetical protein
VSTLVFFSRKTNIFYTTLIQLPMAGLKIKFSIIFVDRVPQLWVQKAPFGFWGISPVSSVTISIKKNLAPPQVIANLFYYCCKIRFFRKWPVHSLRSTFHRLHLLRLWTPMILLIIFQNSSLKLIDKSEPVIIRVVRLFVDSEKLNTHYVLTMDKYKFVTPSDATVNVPHIHTTCTHTKQL